jgi:hypothetical protein
MAEFVNRQLRDGPTGVSGAIQAAIDSDEFSANYAANFTPSGINARFKNAGEVITATPATYPNPTAARGSRYAGIPGYVMQSDILQGIGSSISVRGDTFVIRGYGESLSGSNVMARAWCEVVVQRMPEYTDPTDPPDRWLKTADGSPTTVTNSSAPLNLTTINRLFGRRFNITSFRWLSPSEI